VHGLPSLHPVPFSRASVRHAPLSGLQLPTLHASLNDEQSTLVPLQMPSVQWSDVVQALASLHSVPFSRAMARQEPLSGLQLPTLHASVSVEQSVAIPLQVPSVQLSCVVQRLPSLHSVPLVRAMALQLPFAGLHEPMLQALVSDEQSTVVPPQMPLVQWSEVVQASWSSHGVPFSSGVPLHCPVSGLQEPVTHEPPWVEQSTGVPVQTPFAQ